MAYTNENVLKRDNKLFQLTTSDDSFAHKTTTTIDFNNVITMFDDTYMLFLLRKKIIINFA